MIKIGVVLGSKPSDFAKDPHYALEIRYFQAIEKAGAMPIPITYSNIEEQLKLVDGILLPGGDFVTPACYYVEDECSPYLDEGIWWDAYMAIGNYALEHNIPLLGICGGMQTLGVLLGGKLRQGIESHRIPDNKQIAHSIKIEKDTILHDIFKQDEVSVNSIHREAVAKISNNIKVSAVAEDGTIEAIESKHHNFALGVQWHPECLLDEAYADLKQIKIFEYFIKKCEG